MVRPSTWIINSDSWKRTNIKISTSWYWQFSKLKNITIISIFFILFPQLHMLHWNQCIVNPCRAQHFSPGKKACQGLPLYWQLALCCHGNPHECITSRPNKISFHFWLLTSMTSAFYRVVHNMQQIQVITTTLSRLHGDNTLHKLLMRETLFIRVFWQMMGISKSCAIGSIRGGPLGCRGWGADN